MKYCKSCLLPDSRPGVFLDEVGVCRGCRNHNIKKKSIDYIEREFQFKHVVENAKKRSKGYDCLIPVSGGKDSTWQVIKCLEYGLNVLAVTWRTPGRTEIGQRNLDNLISLGVDHIDYSINPKVEKKFMLQAFEKMGSTAIPMHMAIFAIPPTLALKFEIPLIIWGENSAFEYGTNDDALTGFSLNREWLKKYGVTNGTTAENWMSDNLNSKELTPYIMPKEEDLLAQDIRAIFLGYYFEWDVETSLSFAQNHGFQISDKPKTGIYNYADIDDHFISIHHFLKWYKFGITRSFDNLSLEIRNERITREKAIQKLKEIGDDTPIDDIRMFCDFVGITEKHFFRICEYFRNKEIWYFDNGKWKIKDFIIPDWTWN